MIHLTDVELNDLLDDAGRSGVWTREHLTACPSCRLRFERLQELDAGLRAMQPEPAPAHFTARTMRRLRPGISSSFAWSVLRNVAPLLALAFVLTVLFGVFGSQETSGEGVPAYAPVLSRITSWSAEAGAWLDPYLTADAVRLAASVVALFAVVGIVDRYVVMRLWRRGGVLGRR
jgi:anti-sigma factor RsiW